MSKSYFCSANVSSKLPSIVSSLCAGRKVQGLEHKSLALMASQQEEKPDMNQLQYNPKFQRMELPEEPALATYTRRRAQSLPPKLSSHEENYDTTVAEGEDDARSSSVQSLASTQKENVCEDLESTVDGSDDSARSSSVQSSASAQEDNEPTVEESNVDAYSSSVQSSASSHDDNVTLFVNGFVAALERKAMEDHVESAALPAYWKGHEHTFAMQGCEARTAIQQIEVLLARKRAIKQAELFARDRNTAMPWSFVN